MANRKGTIWTEVQFLLLFNAIKGAKKQENAQPPFESRRAEIWITRPRFKKPKSINV